MGRGSVQGYVRPKARAGSSGVEEDSKESWGRNRKWVMVRGQSVRAEQSKGSGPGDRTD